MTVLHIDSSIQKDGSISRQLTAAIVAGLVEGTDEPVIYHDMTTEESPVIDPRQGDSPAADEFLAADVIVIGAPMYNLGVPARLKAWIDSVSIPRKTFRYTENGPEGLAGGRKIIVAYASGGFHRGPEEDFVDPYLRSFFRLLGIKDIDIVRAEGVNISDDQRTRTMRAALSEVAGITARIREERRQAVDA
ncbi:NAD(P)H-dependent oxidoreductase [Pleomorphomonas sp. JP5]|uniref:FMN-dependent NADH-azoreductase n=1 Tax=Pleomorphomonas sp. JP5 TaxID=2942998 RepID=UPI00204335F0|nr:NAD(P)H-dependent oxidoreductase [Pleomorphomonas sp. JP5]MCM5558585.1 NAD(P)H-dependent oxidoreductase [Pleomorphomonas sp. JP5]